MQQLQSQSKPVVVYDGECAFCRSQIARIRSLDSNGAHEYLTRQDPTAEQRFPVLKHEDFDKGLRLIMPDGSLHTGADAFYEMARLLPATKNIAWLYNVPGVKPIARMIYAVIAANRQRLARHCENDACKL
jgi:predicted DCC family thiol-disulfide oxidoreductase YuxK